MAFAVAGPNLGLPAGRLQNSFTKLAQAPTAARENRRFPTGSRNEPSSFVISPAMRVFAAFAHFLLHIGYFGPLVMGILDSSFLILPFGNDLLVVGMVVHRHQDAPWYVLSAACGSTIGAYLLALVSRKLGEEGIRKIAGKSQYEKLKNRIGSRSGFAVTLAGLAPPPFPFTTVIAAVAALGYPIWRILVINFSARGARFAILSVLAMRYGRSIVGIAQSPPFEWSMAAFIVLCFVASGLSVAHWLRKPRARPRVSHAGH